MVLTVIYQGLLVLFPVAMVYSAAADVLTMTLSNRIALLLAAGFVLLAPLTGMDWIAFAMHFAAGAAVLAAGFLLFAQGWVGGGDAKLAAVIALWLGWDHTLSFIGLSASFGGLMALAILSFRGSVLPQVVLRQPWVQRLHQDKAGIPYGVALAVGALAVYPDTIWMKLSAG
ncbi:MAG: peptidase [Hyphomicrobiales bacterium]|nr:peptidase [Hyphomicrobiales bacterium]